jgi:hypothetical protein
MLDMADPRPLIVPSVHARLTHGEVSPGDAGTMLGPIELTGQRVSRAVERVKREALPGASEVASRLW